MPWREPSCRPRALARASTTQRHSSCPCWTTLSAKQERVAQQQAGQPLTTQRLLDLDVQDADGMLIPARAEQIHLPDNGAADRATSTLFLQTKPVDLKGAAHALLIPAGGAAARQRFHL